MNKSFVSTIFKILLIFLSWRIFLFILLFISIGYVPLAQSDRFLGGGFRNYAIGTELFSWANFDGEHYTAISMFGYKPLEQAFFPVYPLLIRFLALPFSSNFFSFAVYVNLIGFLISNISFFLALIFLWKLIVMDFSEKVAYWTIVVLVTFPTSFYFGSVYNESLFLLLSVASFYFARKNNFFTAGMLGIIASATRVFGILLFPALLIDALNRRVSKKRLIFLVIVPFGLLGYMLYQYISSGDPFAFYNLQTVVGPQHQKGIVSLPQVYFRYIKMIVSLDIHNVLYQTIILEFITGIVFFILPIYGYFKKISLSYGFYALIGFLLPAIQGSFSSSPRYVLVLFPGFIVLTQILLKFPAYVRVTYLLISLLILSLETMLFLRGYWVA